MKTYKSFIEIPKATFDRINGLLKIEDLFDPKWQRRVNKFDARKDEHPYSFGTADFEDGRYICMDIFSGSSNYWIDYQLRENENGISHELYVYDVDYELRKGEVLEFEYEEDDGSTTTYLVEIKIEKEKL